MAFGVQAVNALKWDLLLLSGHQIHSWIGEIKHTIRTNDHIVWTIQLLAVVVICQDVVFSVGSHFDDRSQHAGAVDQPMLPVKSVAVGIAERNHLFFLAIGMKPENLVDGFVAHIEESSLVPHRAFGKAE